MKTFLESEARDDFNRARTGAFFSEIFNLFSSDRKELLSLQEVKEVIRPRGETYRGMQTVSIDRIVGSEGRYQDFSKSFLPRYEYLRTRWQRVDLAHLSDIILPPIKLYEVGGVYFVRDGNHRVSVAKAQGVLAIDAEVVSLDTEIPLHESMTRRKLENAVIDHERTKFLERFQLNSLLPDEPFLVTSPGRYDELTQHIFGHKYYINQDRTVEIPIEEAILSWYRNVYRPIVEVIRKNRLIGRFPGRTHTDLYLWIVKRWDELKARYGSDYPVEEAAQDYSDRYGTGFFRRMKNWLQRLRRRLFPPN
ncbi:MAG: transcriptional regulator [Alkalispirochaeta sp.]